MKLKTTVGYTGVVLTVVLVIYAAYYIFLYSGYSGPLDESGGLTGVRSGAFGDAFGVLNTFFSGLAFSGVLITLILQKQDLAETRAQVSRQQAESQFYNLLNIQQQLVQGFDLDVWSNNKQTTLHGRDCFRRWHSELHNAYHKYFDSEKPDIMWVMQGFEDVLEKHKSDMGLYFRSLYSLFKFIETTDRRDRGHFGRVIRSFLSDYELAILFYNCLSPKGHRFKRFAVAHELFDNLDVERLIKPEHIVHMQREAYINNRDAVKLSEKVKAAKQ